MLLHHLTFFPLLLLRLRCPEEEEEEEEGLDKHFTLSALRGLLGGSTLEWELALYPSSPKRLAQ